MKSLIKKGLSLVVILLIGSFLLLSYTYIARSLKSFVVKTMETNFGTQLSVGHIRLRFPLCLELKNIKINNTIDIAKIYVYPSPASFLLRHTFVFSSVKIVDPVIRIQKQDRQAFADFNILNNDKLSISSKDSRKFFYLSRIDIDNGTLIYDIEDGPSLEFIKIRGIIRNPNFFFVKNQPLLFKGGGFLKNYASDFLSPVKLNGRIRGDGTIKAKFQVQDVALDTFGPIYARYLKDIVAKGKVYLDSKVQLSKNDLKANCFFKICDIILQKDTQHKIDRPLVVSFILGFNFKDNVLNINNLRGNLLSFLFDKT